MGILLKGTWVTSPRDTNELQSLLQRDGDTLRNWITPDGRSLTQQIGFAAEQNRYHLYISQACPFAHRTSIMRHLNDLEEIISMSEVDPVSASSGWEFSEEYPDPLYGKKRLSEIYALSNNKITSRVTTPVLWDKKRKAIVSNDSGDIMRIFNSAFNKLTENTQDFYPLSLRSEIDELNSWLFDNLNVGVYRAGFADSQLSYERASQKVFNALDMLEQRLDRQRFLHGASLTESDWRLFTTLIRFDAVYHPLFKLNQARLTDYRNLIAYTRDLYQQSLVAETVNITTTKLHYFASFTSINPKGFVASGGETNFSTPHYRVIPVGMEKYAC